MAVSHQEDDKSSHLLATSVSMVVLCTVAVCLRFISPFVSKRVGFWWDDWTAFIALPFVIVASGLDIAVISYGFGKHEDTLGTPEEIQQKLLRGSLLLYVSELFYNTSLSLIKASVLLLYWRIFSLVYWYKICVYVIGFLVFGWFVAINLTGILQCSPVKRAWDKEVPGTCLDTYAIYLGPAISNVIIDFFILILPLPILFQLKVKTAQRVGLVFLFICGYTVIAISIARLVIIVNTDLTSDITWRFVSTLMLVQLEPGIALIGVCLPSMVHMSRYLWKHRIGPHFGISHSTNDFYTPSLSNSHQLGKMSSAGENEGAFLRLDESATEATAKALPPPSESNFSKADTVNEDSVMEDISHGIHVRQEISVNLSPNRDSV